MNRAVYVLLLSALGLMSQVCARAQCTDYPPVTQSCSSFHCSGQYSSNPPPGGSAWGDTGIELKCCNHIVIIFSGVGCGQGLLRDPSVRKTLEILADAGVRVALKGCGGHFGLYQPGGLRLAGSDQPINLGPSPLPLG